MGFGYLISLVLLIWLLVSTGGSAARIGGWEEMRDLSNDQHVNEIAEFAVAEINKKANSQLKFLGVIKGQMQVVSGINYRLVVAVQDRDGSDKYEAVVLEKPCMAPPQEPDLLSACLELISPCLLPSVAWHYVWDK